MQLKADMAQLGDVVSNKLDDVDGNCWHIMKIFRTLLTLSLITGAPPSMALPWPFQTPYYLKPFLRNKKVERAGLIVYYASCKQRKGEWSQAKAAAGIRYGWKEYDIPMSYLDREDVKQFAFKKFQRERCNDV